MNTNEQVEIAEKLYKTQRRKYSLAANGSVLVLLLSGYISKNVSGFESLKSAMPLVAFVVFIAFMYFMKKSLTCTLCGGSMKINGRTCSKCSHSFENPYA